MSDPNEHFAPEPTGNSCERTFSDLPPALADVQQRLQQFRPRQPQLDLAMLEHLAAASRPSPPRASAGISRIQLAYAIAASWLCGAFFGAALLFGIGYHSLREPVSDSLAASGDRVAAQDHVDQATAGDEAIGGGTADGGAVADAQRPAIVSDNANAAALADRERRLPAARDPSQSDALVTITGGAPSHRVGSSETRWEGPLSANSLRLPPSQRSLVRSHQRPPNPLDESTPSDRTSDTADAAAAAPEPSYAPDLDTFTPTVPKTRQQWLDDLLAVPPSNVL